MQVKVGDSRLRNRHQVLLLGFLAEITRHQGLDNFVLDIFGETLANDGGRNFAFAEAGNARQLLVAVHDALGFSLTTSAGISMVNSRLQGFDGSEEAASAVLVSLVFDSIVKGIAFSSECGRVRPRNATGDGCAKRDPCPQCRVPSARAATSAFANCY